MSPTPITTPPPPKLLHPSLHPVLRKRDKSACILIVFKEGGGDHVPGVLLVSMTTSSGAIKISGANGAGRVGVTPKEDKHNYSEIERQSGNGEVCKKVSQADRCCSLLTQH